jgi:hypothetical protein
MRTVASRENPPPWFHNSISLRSSLSRILRRTKARRMRRRTHLCTASASAHNAVGEVIESVEIFRDVSSILVDL